MILTQTNWLKMPPQERRSSYEPQDGVRTIGTTLLKKHKILPRPQEDRRPQQFYTSPTRRAQSRDIDLDAGFSYISESDASSPHVLKHASKRIGDLPPTPPTHSRQSSGNQASITSAPRIDPSTIDSSSRMQPTPQTPPDQRSPPTPDVTPPQPRQVLLHRPKLHEGIPTTASSRTESFKTAQENLESEDDEASTVRPGLWSTGPSQSSVPQVPSESSRRREVGLGLGIPPRSDGTTTPRAERNSEQEFVVFDGHWVDSSDAMEVEPEWDNNLMRNVTVRKRPGRDMSLHLATSPIEVLENDVVTPTAAARMARSLPLQERIARHRRERDISDRKSTERFAEQISWPPSVADPESPVVSETKRFSIISAQSGVSAIVEAFVVDALPTRARTLRKTKKLSGLRDLSGQSVASTTSEPPIPLHHARGRIPDRDQRSVTTNPTTSSPVKPRSHRQVLRSGAVPVVVIPARRSSTKSSGEPSLRSTTSHKSRRTNSLSSAPLSASSKFNDPAYIEARNGRKRSLSESESSRSVRTIDFPPDIPARSSSLSAPTSRNTSRAPSIAATDRDVSRAGSLTTESLKAHNMLQATKHSLPDMTPSHHLHDTPTFMNHHHHQLRLDHNGDPVLGSRRSTQATPFSQYSYETAGTAAELSEAQAMEIFPHHNKSLLVVQHQNSSAEQSPVSLQPFDTTPTTQQPPPIMTLNGDLTDGPVTPPKPNNAMDEVDSPLRNPRDPPIPPDIKFIPPTPAGVTPGHEEDRQLGYDPEERRLAESKKRNGSLMRRAFSNSRRHSEIREPGVGFLKRTFSLSNNKRIEDTPNPMFKEPTPPFYPNEDLTPAEEHKLHPFWRPAYFWDDEREGAFDEDDYAPRYPIIDNRPKPKRVLSDKLKRTFAILPIQDDESQQADRLTMRRSPSGNNLRVVKRSGSKSSLQRSNSYSQRPLSEGDNVPFGHGFKDGNGGHNRSYMIPGLGLKVEYVGWGALKRRMSGRGSERKREQRRGKLRESIGMPGEVRGGVDDVLGRRDSSRI